MRQVQDFAGAEAPVFFRLRRSHPLQTHAINHALFTLFSN
jgi:hypothetical protein